MHSFLSMLCLLMQCLIKKDRQDQNDPHMSEFYDKLNNAYNDPALLPKRYTGRHDGHTTPLLHSSDVSP